ncbi:MAG: hypothetical protein ACK4GN_01365 [Runella sp.]
MLFITSILCCYGLGWGQATKNHHLIGISGYASWGEFNSRITTDTQWGYFIGHALVLGTGVSIDYFRSKSVDFINNPVHNQTLSFMATPFLRYYFLKKHNTIRPIAQVLTPVGFVQSGIKGSQSNIFRLNAEAGVGAAIFASQRISFDTIVSLRLGSLASFDQSQRGNIKIGMSYFFGARK